MGIQAHFDHWRTLIQDSRNASGTGLIFGMKIDCSETEAKR